MERKHLILPAALLAGSALLAGRAAIGSLQLGPDAQPTASVGTLVDITDEQDVAARTAQLDAAEQRIDALDAQVPPALPADPAPATARAATQVRVASPAPTAARASSGHGGRGRDHAEDDDSSGRHGGEDDGGHGGGGDDHGGGDDD